MNSAIFKEALGIHPETHGEDQRAFGNSLNNDVNKTTAAVINSDGSVEHRQTGVVGSNTEEVIRPTNAKLFESIRTREGHPQTEREMTPESVVTIPGVGEMQLRSAILAGYLQQDAQGNYSAGPALSGEDVQQQQEEHPDLQGEAVSEEAEAKLNNLLSNTDGNTQLAALSEIATSGVISDRTMGQLASQLGVEPADVQGAIEPVRSAFEGQAREAIESQGVPADEVLAWAYSEKPEAMQKAIFAQGAERSTQGYKALAQEWLLSADQHSPETILNAEFGEGVSAHRDGKGHIILTDAQGRTFEWRAAVTAGIVKVSRG